MSKPAASLLLILLWTAACNPPSAETPATTPTKEISGLRGVRYCEIIPVVQSGLSLTVEVYNTLGLNDCPQHLWEKLDADALAKERGAKLVKLNGPRFWVLDAMLASGASTTGKTADFGGIQMQLRATLETKLWQATVGDTFYTPNEVKRNTVWKYSAGQMVYELVSPEGDVYRMQSYAQITAKSLTLAELSNLGTRLQLPEGWRYQARVLEEDSSLSANGLAYVINDELYNSYQKVTR